MRTGYLVAGLVAFISCGALVAACGSDPTTSGFDPNPTSGGDAGKGGDGGSTTSFGGGGGGGEAAPPCVGLQCQQADCGGGQDTTLTGTVYMPNGKNPLYNVIVYVPNAPVKDFTKGVTCDQCGVVASGNPVTTTLSNPDGTFSLPKVPYGDNIPVVFQLGKWRRQITVPNVAKCQENKLTDADQTRLPKNQTEGSLPHIALTTGGYDNLGCMLPKVGIDPMEFGNGVDSYAKAVNVYNGNGGKSGAGTTAATPFWNDVNQLKQYDLVLLSCEGDEWVGQGNGNTKDTTSFTAVSQYLAAGGRIFTTDFMYTWYKDSPDMGIQSVSNIPGGAPVEGSSGFLPGAGPGDPIDIDTSFPKGMALATWLKTVFPSSPNTQKNQVMMDVVFGNIQTTDMMKAQVWARSQNNGGGNYPRVQTMNVPVGAPTAMQCGKGVHIDAHVDSPGAPGADSVTSSFPGGCTHPLSEGEALLAFFFFDLASCIQNDSQPPPTPKVN
jgi:hypothetical protein